LASRAATLLLKTVISYKWHHVTSLGQLQINMKVSNLSSMLISKQFFNKNALNTSKPFLNVCATDATLSFAFTKEQL